MIIEALVEHYGHLDHDICSIDFEWKKPDLSVEIGNDGYPIGFAVDEDRNWDVMRLPNEINRTNNPISQRLYDKAQYVFGCELSEKSDKSYETQARKFREDNLELISSVNTPAANAFRNFLNIPLDDPKINDFIRSLKENKDAKGNLIVFCYDGRFIQDDEQIWSAVCKVQEDERNRETDKEPKMLSLISGEEEVIARTHPKIKGVAKDASYLISYNFASVENGNRMGLTQSLNARIGKTESIKYSKVLNYLLNNQDVTVGDMHILPFSSSHTAENIFMEMIDPSHIEEEEDGENNDDEIHGIVDSLIKGNLDEKALKEFNEPFNILCVSVPVKSRIVVHFFYEGTFGELVENVTKYYRNTMIENARGKIACLEPTKAFRLMSKGPLAEGKSFRDTSLKNYMSESKKLGKNMQTEFFMCVLNGRKFPLSLFKRVVSSLTYPQIYEDSDLQALSRQRVTSKIQFIKAFLQRNTNIFKGENLVSLNTDVKNPAYLMGRIFAIIESTESKEELNPYYKYYKKAKSCPSAAHSLMMDKMRMRLSHDEEKHAVYISAMKQIGEILDCFEGGELPSRLSLIEQGSWELGYHHQLNHNIQEALKHKEAQSDTSSASN